MRASDLRVAEETLAVVSQLEVIYLAHPVGAADRAGVRANLERAESWLAWLVARCESAFQCSWLGYVRALDDHDPDQRRRGMRDQMALLGRCDGILLVGGRVSTGMDLERAEARRRGMPVFDLTLLGDEPGTHGLIDTLREQLRLRSDLEASTGVKLDPAITERMRDQLAVAVAAEDRDRLRRGGR